MIRDRILLLPLLASLTACKVEANATVHADGDADADGEIAIDADIDATTPDPAEPASIRIEIRRQGDELVHQGGEINFASNEAVLEGERTFATLDAYAQLLDRYPALTLSLEGHTDSRGGEAHNRDLSQRRAEAVRDWLIENGIAAERLGALGFGEQSPKLAEPPECLNKNAESAAEWCEAKIWSANRRSAFKILSGAESLPEGDLVTRDEKDEKDENAEPADSPDLDDTAQWPGSGVYLYGSPALFSATVADRNESAARNLSYRWGVGVGYLWRKRRFAAGLGFGLSHVPVNIDRASPRCDDIECVNAHDLLLDLEVRIGGGGRRVIGYVLFAPGLALGVSQVGDDRFTTPGFGLDFGAGLWGFVWRGLFLGGELVLTPSIYGDHAGSFHSSASSVGVGLRALVGWHFGWNRAQR